MDYEIRSHDHSEDAAVSYVLSFINDTDSAVEVQFSLYSISAVDNIGTKYSDNFAMAATWYAEYGRYGCISIQQPVYPIEQHLTVPAKASSNLTLYLNVAGTTGDCRVWGVGRSRVPFETNYVDLEITSVKYRTNQLHEFSDMVWRLKR